MLILDVSDVFLLLFDLFAAKNRRVAAYVAATLFIVIGVVIIGAGLLDIFGDAAVWIGGGVVGIGLVALAIAPRLGSDGKSTS